MRVLLADDDTRVGKHVRQALTAEGYAVDYAQPAIQEQPELSPIAKLLGAGGT